MNTQRRKALDSYLYHLEHHQTDPLPTDAAIEATQFLLSWMGVNDAADYLRDYRTTRTPSETSNP